MNKTYQAFIISVFLLGFSITANSFELKQTAFDLELQKVRYNNVVNDYLQATQFDKFDDAFQDDGASEIKKTDIRSPGKAFLMSFMVPGLGQYYNGSKIKAAAFFGIEIASWVFNKKFDNEGADLQAEFEAFNRANWQEVRYDSCLAAFDPDRVEGDFAFSHHLPETRTQQYYEMTGKYNQFIWGWTDARLDDTLNLFDVYESLGDLSPDEPFPVPVSLDRETYEQMRDDSNQKYKSARITVMLILFNHLVSGMEAFFAAKSHNKKSQDATGFSQWQVKAAMKSYYTEKDTPYLQLSYKF